MPAMAIAGIGSTYKAMAEDGPPGVSTHTIGRALHAAGLGWQKSRPWCETGMVARKRKREGVVVVTDPDAAAKT